MKFLNFLNESINDKGIFKACFLCGNPGAGKSYTLSKIVSGQISPRIVNTDKMYTLFSSQWKNWSNIADKIKLLTENQLSLYLNSLLPLFIETTSSSTPSILRRKGLLESIGYDTMMIFLNTTLETSLKRNEKRERKVDEDFLKEVFFKTQKHKIFLKNKFDLFIEIDNDVGELNNEIILNVFKKTLGFFSSSIKNPIGQENFKKIKENNEKYLTPTIYSKQALDKITTIWYKN